MRVIFFAPEVTDLAANKQSVVREPLWTQLKTAVLVLSTKNLLLM